MEVLELQNSDLYFIHGGCSVLQHINKRGGGHGWNVVFDNPLLLLASFQFKTTDPYENRFISKVFQDFTASAPIHWCNWLMVGPLSTEDRNSHRPGWLKSTNCAFDLVSPVQSLVSQQRGSTSLSDVHQNQMHLLLWQIWVPAGEIHREFSHAFSAPSCILTSENSCPESCTISAGTSGWCGHVTKNNKNKNCLQMWRRQIEWWLSNDKGVFFPSDWSGCRSQDAACFPVWIKGLYWLECHRKLQVMHEHSPYLSQQGRLCDSCRACLSKQWIATLKHSATSLRKQESFVNSGAVCGQFSEGGGGAQGYGCMTLCSAMWGSRQGGLLRRGDSIRVVCPIW